MCYKVNANKTPLLSLALILSLLTICTPSKAQFEQMLSVNLTGGLFNTVGSRGWEAEWSTGKDDREPTLMPNFRTGYSVGGSFQVNLSRHFSIEAFVVLMGSPGWYYDASDQDQEPFNYLYYEAYADTIDYIVEFSGENEMTLRNLAIGLAPKYYFLPGKKLSPFVSAGIAYHTTQVNFIDNEYGDYEAHGRLDELETGDVNQWFSDHSGIGFSVGAGAEYGINNFVGLFVLARYHFVPLKAEAFIYETKYADLHALNLQLGLRFSFLKSKEL